MGTVFGGIADDFTGATDLAAVYAIEELEETASPAMMTGGSNPHLRIETQIAVLLKTYDVEWN